MSDEHHKLTSASMSDVSIPDTSIEDLLARIEALEKSTAVWRLHDRTLKRITALEAQGENFVDLLDRIYKLEEQVRELEGHVHDNKGCCVILPSEQKASGWPERHHSLAKDTPDNIPPQPPLDNMGEVQTVHD